MWKDEIVEEIHHVREEYAARLNYDLHAIYKDIRERQAESGREYVTLPPRKPPLWAETHEEQLEYSDSPLQSTTD